MSDPIRDWHRRRSARFRLPDPPRDEPGPPPVESLTPGAATTDTRTEPATAAEEFNQFARDSREGTYGA